MAHIKKEIWKKKAVNNGHFAPGQPQPDPRKALEGRWHQKVNQPPVSDSPGLWTAPHVKGGGHNFWGKAAQICSEKFSKEGAAGSHCGSHFFFIKSVSFGTLFEASINSPTLVTKHTISRFFKSRLLYFPHGTWLLFLSNPVFSAHSSFSHLSRHS